VLRFVLKGVAEGDLEPFFPLGHSVLLHGLRETAPPAFLFGPKDGEVSLFEEFDLVVHVHDAEDESSGGGGRVRPRSKTMFCRSSWGRCRSRAEAKSCEKYNISLLELRLSKVPGLKTGTEDHSIVKQEIVLFADCLHGTPFKL
jgi:hypothetical protein